MPRAGALDVLIVSLGSTAGLRAADEQLASSLRRAGAEVEVTRARAPNPRRTLMLTDLAWARAARRAAAGALRELAPRAIVYSSTTAALFWPRPGAVRFDAPSSGNRPGRHGLWQRPLERRRLAGAPLLLPWSAGALSELPDRSRRPAHALVLPVAVEPSAGIGRPREIAAVTYAANPAKKGTSVVLSAWRRLRSELGQGELVIAGASARELEHAGIEMPGAGEGVRVVGAVAPEEFRALLVSSRAFVCAPAREDYGLAQLEALADGCMLVTTPAPGPYAALPIARELDPRLVDADLHRALRAALEHPRGDYAERARPALAAFSREAIDELVARELIPRLLGSAP